MIEIDSSTARTITEIVAAAPETDEKPHVVLEALKTLPMLTIEEYEREELKVLLSEALSRCVPW